MSENDQRVTREDEECPECGLVHDGSCEGPGNWFLRLTEAEQEGFIRESLEAMANE